MRFPYLLFILLLIAFSACQQAKKIPGEIIAFDDLPFGVPGIQVEAFFQQKGWKVLERTPERMTFFFPAAVPEEFRKLPVMGAEGSIPEPYTIQVFFGPGEKAIVMILRRFDTEKRLNTFFRSITDEYGIDGVKLTETSEKTELGNELFESTGAAEHRDTLFLVLRSRVVPVEEKLRNGMNDEVEIRIFPRKWNEGITIEALLGH